MTRGRVTQTPRSLFILFTFLLLIPILLSQPTPIRADEFAPDPVPTGPAEMAYQPSAEAETLAELMVPDTIPNPITATVSFPELTPGQLSFTQTAPITATIVTTLNPARDNAVSVNNDQVGVIIESDTFTQTTDLQFTLLAVAPADPISPTLPVYFPADAYLYETQKTFLSFQIEALDAATAQPIETFNKKVRLSIDVRDLGYTFPDHGTFFLAYRDETNPDHWTEVPLTVYQPGFYSADVSHFSDWTTGWRPDGWTMSWNPPSADGFSGAAAYSYPFQLPPGRNGLQPSLALSYANSAMNGAIRRVSGGTIASGWSLSKIAIVRTGVELQGLTSLLMPDTFRLVLNGTGYKLTATTETINGGTRYTADSGPQLFVLKYPDYWVVMTGEGTHYRLGYTNSSRTWHYLVLNGHLDEDEDPESHATYDQGIIEWHVDTVTDTSGNQITYEYNNSVTTDTNSFISYCPWGGFCAVRLFTKASRLIDVYYNFTTRITSLPPAHNVARLSPANAATRLNLLYNEDGGRFSNILIYHNSAQPIREYVVDGADQQVINPGSGCQSGTNNIVSHTRVINTITEYGWNNATGERFSLPATTFTYTDRHNFTRNGQPCFIYKHLQSMTNGYGGKIEFTYANDGRSWGQFVNTTSEIVEYPQIGYSHYVTEVRQMDGRGHTSKITYARHDQCYNQQEYIGTSCPSDDDAPDLGVLAGFEHVQTFYWKLNGTTLERQEETFYHVDQERYGRPYRQDSKDSDEDVRQRTLTTYFMNLGEFHPVESVVTYLYEDGENSNSLSQKVTYAYDPSFQGGTQYGNLTHISEYDDANATTPYRITRRRYDVNTDILTVNGSWYWLVSAMRSEIYVSGTGTPLAVKYWHYDGHLLGAKPTQGWVTRIRQGDPTISCNDVQGGGGAGCTTASKTIDTVLVYDGTFGNVLETQSYATYGYQTFNGTTPLNNYPPTSTARSTFIKYNPVTFIYPVKVTDDAGYVTKFDVYGFKNADNVLISPDGFSRQTGLLKQVTTANGQLTLYEYDPFGRLTNVYDALGDRGTPTNPWDGNPVTRYQYYDNPWQGAAHLDPAGNKPFPIVVSNRPLTYHTGSGGTGYEFKQVTYYDGLGRPIQSQDRWVDVNGEPNRQDRIVTTAYDDWGRTTCTTIPYTVDTYTIRTGGVGSGFLGDVSHKCTSQTHTTTVYDDTGRVEEVQDANNNPTARYAYGITTHVTVDSFTQLQRTTITDANNHITSQFTNSRGQLVLVREFTGTGSTVNPVDPYVHLADTRYRYDLFGNLLRVGTSDWTHSQPADNNSAWLRATTMSYDAFGRKTGMTDPDMGTWAYSYDAASNLTRQQDAKGQVLCFFYDNLNRITSKRRDNPVNGCSGSDTLLASYSYFGPGNGSSSGQVSEIQWSDANNRETFTYNPKGLLSTHTRWLDGNNYSLIYGEYDLLNRPTSLTYPNQEVVTMGYDREGENVLIAGPNTLVTGIHYNEQGQVALLDRASFDTDYTYWPLTGGTAGNNNGRLYTIQHGTGADTLPDFKYLYDNVGNIKTLETWVKPGASHLIDTQTFTYDELNRLKNASGSGYNPEMIAYSQTYQYDRLGNIDERQEKTCNPTCGPLWNVYDYSYGSKPQAVTSVGGQGSYSYDANGNMSGRTEGGTAYTQIYDVENRLVSVMGGGSSTTFAYDASGQRVKTMATTPGNSRTITYYPFPNYEEEHQQTWQAGVCYATCPGSWVTDTTVKRSLYGLAGQAIATRVVSSPGQSTDGLFYFLGDHLGSTRMLTTTSGSPIADTKAHFLPYGSYRGGAPINDEITDKGFTGHKHSDDLGLIYMNARFYVPYLNRFISADVIVPDPADPQSYNRYSYVLGNPLKFIDPTGHFTTEAIYQYLLDYECGGSPICADDMMTLWSQNSTWWGMLLAASGYDILYGLDEGVPVTFVFQGNGMDQLNGITIDTWGFSIRLSDLFSGEYTLSGASWLPSSTYSISWEALRFHDTGYVAFREDFAAIGDALFSIYGSQYIPSTLGSIIREAVGAGIQEGIGAAISAGCDGYLKGAGVGCEVAFSSITAAIGEGFRDAPIQQGNMIRYTDSWQFHYQLGPAIAVNFPTGFANQPTTVTFAYLPPIANPR